MATQNILREEARLCDVIDPLGGSYYIEELTDQMEAAINAVIEKIDTAGGMYKVVEEGWVQTMIGDSAQVFQEQIESGKQKWVGVNCYGSDDDPSFEPLPCRPDPEAVGKFVSAFKDFKAGRSQAGVENALSALSHAAESKTDNIFEKVVHAAEKGVTHGEIVACLRRELGTGPPGVGKSSLVNACIHELRKNNEKVAVIAIDPSSPVSGGAVLGDRFRMGSHAGDAGLFIRSVANRGHLGGLSSSVSGIMGLIEAAGWNVVLLETVGAGQSDTELADIADIRIVIQSPGLGDEIQAIKAGILEIADIIVVNKADMPLADITLRQLETMIEICQEKKNRLVEKQGASLGRFNLMGPLYFMPRTGPI